MTRSFALALGLSTLVACGDGTVTSGHDSGSDDSALPELSVISSSVAFSGQPVGTVSAPFAMTLTNTHARKSVTVATVSADLPFHVVGAAASSLPVLLGPGESFTVEVTFAPTAPGTFTGRLLCDLEKAPDQSFPLSGTAILGTGCNDCPSGKFAQLYEAESATVVPPMTLGSDAAALSGGYISPTIGADSATPTRIASMPIDLPATQSYYLWARIKSGDSGGDALYVGVDASWDRVFPVGSAAYEWVRVATSQGSSAFGFALTAGTHTMQVGYGEIGARLDGLFVTSDPNQVPTFTVDPSDPGTTVCGNGIVEPGEACDGGACCGVTCHFVAAGTICRSSGASCDVAETCSGASAACPADVVASCTSGEVKAFPTAEGFGAYTVGGRGGRIIHVTNLNDSGPGSLREAVAAVGPRIVVFDVSGTIELKSDVGAYGPESSYLTVAGQTSPGGVQTKGQYGLWVNYGAHDVIVRHMRVRPGGPEYADDTGVAMGIYSPTSDQSYNVIFDHCSMQWGTDNQFDVAFATDVTLQWSLIAEGIVEGGYGSSILMYARNGRASFHHNLTVHTSSRNPLVTYSEVADFRNNVIYNWRGDGGAELGGYAKNQSAFVNMVNNHYIPGANSSLPYLWVANGGPTRLDGAAADRGGTRVYTEGNWGPNCPVGCADDWDNAYMVEDYFNAGLPDRPRAQASQFRSMEPFPAPSVATDPVPGLKDKLLPSVGASRPSRDAVDARLIEDARNGTGNLNDVHYGGPWPDLASGAPPPPRDSDDDGISDAWELAHGLNPNNAADGPATAANGYTNVENYLNELAGDPIP